jgi:hypothetical protein
MRVSGLKSSFNTFSTTSPRLTSQWCRVDLGILTPKHVWDRLLAYFKLALQAFFKAKAFTYSLGDLSSLLP